MRSKTPLTLMEQVVMILVFALAAAVCIQVFVYAGQQSRYYETRDRAVLAAQNAAEALKAGNDGYFSGINTAAGGNAGYAVSYNEAWQPAATEGNCAYQLRVTYTDSGDPYLWTAEVTVWTAEGELLISLPVAGQNEGVGSDA